MQFSAEESNRRLVENRQIAEALRLARLRRGTTQRDMAARVGVSTRLWAEFERGERPNVSLQTVLRMADALGLHVTLGDGRPIAEVALSTARERAERRRAEWTGGHAPLGSDRGPSVQQLTSEERFVAVAEVSRLAYALADGAAHAVVAENKPRPYKRSPRPAK